MTTYDRIGRGYALKRRPDPRWAAIIDRALGDARTVLNVGAGTGSYEPPDRRLVALEPSREMIDQRPVDAAPAVRGVAGTLPFRDDAFDAALAVLTVHHWPDAAAGLSEMCRVAHRQVVVTWDPVVFAERFWLIREYLPELGQRELRLAAGAAVAAHMTVEETLPLLVPYDCSDGVFGAYWRRPEAYLDADVRASISGLALTPAAVLDPALGRLEADLRSGAGRRRHANLLELEEMDLGYYAIVGRARSTLPRTHRSAIDE